MTPEILFMLLLLAATLVVFILEIFPMEVTALGLLGILLLTGIVDGHQATQGLSNPAVVTIGALFVLSHALTKTGVLEVAGNWIGDRVGARKWLGIGIMLVAVTLSSALLNNTAIVAIFIPLAIHFSHRFHISPSKILMPVSFAAIAGGTLTLIGTSTNLIVNSFVIEAGHAPLGMFEFARLGWLFAVMLLVYTLAFARRLLPARAALDSLTRKYHMGTYLTELRVVKESALVGQTILGVGLNQNYDTTVLAILRDKERLVEGIRSLPLRPDDIMIVRGTVDDIMRLRKEQGVALLSDIKLSDDELSSNDQVLAEGLVTRTSRLAGRTLREIDFRRHYGAFVLAVRRHGATIREKIARIHLRPSDTLLMLAPKDRITELRRSEELIIISEVKAALHRERYWWVVLLVLPLLMLLVSLGVVDILRASMLAVVLLLVIRAIDIQEAYRSVEWSVLLLIAAFVPVGYAMSETGTAQFIASGVLQVARLVPPEQAPHAALGLLYLITIVLTEMVSNNATALVLAPVGISIAATLGVDLLPFMMAVAFGASAAFMTPISYQTNMMVYGPGSYRFMDYVRFGAIPNVLVWLLGMVLIPRIWPF